MTTEQERLMIELQGIIDDLDEATNWETIDRLTHHLQNIKDDIEEVLE